MPYHRESAVRYATTWALSRNPHYFDFENLGGDCTNFISQCIHAGEALMNYTPTLGWYYISLNARTPSWSSATYLYDFLIRNNSIGPRAREVPIMEMEPGDVIQLGDSNNHFYHSLFVVETGRLPSRDNIRICTHTYDSSYRPLNTYISGSIRYLKISVP